MDREGVSIIGVVGVALGIGEDVLSAGYDIVRVVSSNCLTSMKVFSPRGELTARVCPCFAAAECDNGFPCMGQRQAPNRCHRHLIVTGRDRMFTTLRICVPSKMDLCVSLVSNTVLWTP